MKQNTIFVFSLLAIGILIASMPLYLYLGAPEDLGQIQLRRFSSYEELKSFLNPSPQEGFYILDGRGMQTFSAATEALEGGDKSAAVPDYSTTNIQVAGVDEADIVKTDGEYIYMVSDSTVLIIRAYPPEKAQVLSKINLNNTIKGIFINDDKLAVFEDEYSFYGLYERSIFYETPRTSIKVYDISDREDPVLKRDFSIDGCYFNSRMIGDYVYAIANQIAYVNESDVLLPKLYSDNKTDEISAVEIYYSDVSDYFYTFTTIVAVNVKNDAQEPTHETVLLGGTRAIYVSQNNIYLTFPEYPMNTNGVEGTVIHRIHIEEDSITFEATGQVPGYVLNQFSMDEHKNHFRIATTSGHVARTWEQATSKNNLYVLDMDLNVVGKLEDLAPGETIYSARLMGDRGYLVTFRKVDPLFVIDLKEPTDPKVLGKLKVTGYSDYLHIYDENHVIGIGKETEAAEEGDFAWYQGVKISLFDVSNVSNPVEVDKYEIGDRGTDSPVLSDHKALLFDRSKNLLVIPVLVAEIDEAKYPNEIPPNAYGEYVWQGAYVFHISVDEGLVFRGGITHLENEDELMKSGYYFLSPYSVKRSLYIENVLYTISDKKIKMNNLENLVEINEVELP